MKEVFEFFNLWAAIPLTLAGFAMAYVQLRKTTGAAQAATATAVRATESLSSNLVMVIAHQLMHIERELERSVRDAQQGVLIDYLGQWRFQAGQLHSLVLKMNDERKLAQAIQSSITVAGRVKVDIGSPGTDLAEATTPALAAINKVSAELGRLTADRTIRSDAQPN